MFKEIYESNEMYREAVKKLREERPSLPSFDPFQDNTEDWKHKSGIQQGYDLILTKIDPTFNK